MSLYSEFSAQLSEQFRDYGYSWTNSKAKSCDWILKHIPTGKGVDVGGTAYLVKKAQEMPGVDMTFFDFFPPQDPEIKQYIAADMAEFGNHFEPQSLDFITTRHTLEHCLNPLFQLWQYNRCLKDDGSLIVIVPMHSKRWVWFYSHFSCLPMENWLMLFHTAGFKVVSSTAGTWKPSHPEFIEHRFILKVEQRDLRLERARNPGPV